MKRYTAESLEKTWGSDDSANARAKRGRWSTGPNEDELVVFERFIKRAISGIRNPKALVLGATTELRDLAIKNGCDTLAVDLSHKLLALFNGAMDFKDSEKNAYMKCDWFRMKLFLAQASFDVVLADCSLNNVPPEDNSALMGIVSSLLKKEGYFITRNFMFCPEEKKREMKDLIREYNEGRNTPVGLFLEAGMYTKYKDIAYDMSKKELFWQRMTDDLINEVEGKISKKEMAYIRNVGKHAKVHSSIIFPIGEFEKMLRKSFKIEDIVKLDKYVYTRGMPIYFLKKK